MRIRDWSSDVCSSDLGNCKCPADQPGHHRILKRGDGIEDADEIGLNIAAQIVGAVAGCASISDAEPPPLFFALRKIGPLVARLPRAMAIDRLERLGRDRAKPQPISRDWRSEERPGGKERVSTCRIRCAPAHSKKNTIHKQ